MRAIIRKLHFHLYSHLFCFKDFAFCMPVYWFCYIIFYKCRSSKRLFTLHVQTLQLFYIFILLLVNQVKPSRFCMVLELLSAWWRIQVACITSNNHVINNINQSILGWDEQEWWNNSCCSFYELQFSFSKVQSWFSCSQFTTESLV